MRRFTVTGGGREGRQFGGGEVGHALATFPTVRRLSVTADEHWRPTANLTHDCNWQFREKTEEGRQCNAPYQL